MLDQVKRFMRYPRAAIDNNWTGNVTVRLVLGSNGEIASLTVQQSSGYKMLDQEALESVRKSKRRSVIPAELLGKEIPYEIPVTFSLEDEGGENGARIIGDECRGL